MRFSNVEKNPFNICINVLVVTVSSRKFNIRRNKRKVNYIETGLTVILMLFQLLMIKFCFAQSIST